VKFQYDEQQRHAAQTHAKNTSLFPRYEIAQKMPYLLDMAEQ